MKKIKKIEIDETKVITTKSIQSSQELIEQELRELTKEDLLLKLNFEENDPKTIKLIEKIIKEKK